MLEQTGPAGPFVYIDHAGTTVGGTQTAVTYNSARQHFFFLNESDTNMRICMGDQIASATVGLLIVPGYYWSPDFTPIGAVTVYCAAAGKGYSCGEFIR